MRETTIANVKVDELPERWREQAGLSGAERVDIVIRAPGPDDLAALRALARRASSVARKKGLTGRKLSALLKEAKAARRR